MTMDELQGIPMEILEWQDGSGGRALVAKPDNLSSITWWKTRTDFYMLSLTPLHKHNGVQTHTHIHIM